MSQQPSNGLGGPTEVPPAFDHAEPNQSASYGNPNTGYQVPPTGSTPPPGMVAYGWQPMRPEAPNATLVLILGILGLVVMPLLAPVAWIVGSRSRAEMRSQPPGTYSNEGAVTAGWVCGIVGSVMLIAVIAILIFALVILFAAGSTVSEPSIIGW